MDKKLTIKDIAQLAGVSKGTVDRVLHKRGKVSEDALLKVNAVLSEINYEPNFMARSLKNNKVYSICVSLPDPSLDSYWLPCVKGIEDVVQKFKAYNLQIKIFYFDPESTESFISCNESILKMAPDAVMLVPLFYKETLNVVEKYNDLGIIVSTFNNQIQSPIIESFVGQDLFMSGRVAAKLLDLLYKKGNLVIIHIDESYENASHMQEKERGFRTYFSEKENSDYAIQTLKLHNPTIEKDFKDFLVHNPNLDGIFVTTSKSYHIAKIASDENASKIGIIGYDLVAENCTFLNQGAIDFLIHQNPKRQAYLGGMGLAEFFIFGKEIPKTTLLPIDIINSENINSYLE
jgi:LacI family transcriptional regulator